MSEEKKVVVKKVRPYPFDLVLEGGGRKFTVQVLKLAMHGFLADMKKSVIHVGEIFQIQFELPALHRFVTTTAKVIKTYDRANPKEHKVDRIAELHFLQLTDEHKALIGQFLKAIRQTGQDL